MKLFKTFFLVFFLVLILETPQKLFSQSLNGVDSVINQIYISLYQYDFDKADSLKKQIEYLERETLQSQLALANYYWWNLRSGKDSAYNYNLCMDELNNAEQLLKTKNKKALTDSNLFYAINIYAFKARLQIYGEQYIKALNYLRKTIPYLEKSFGKEPEFEGFGFVNGMYDYFAAHALAEYPFVYPYFIFYPKGNRQKGIENLKATAKSQNANLRTESTYFLMKIYLRTEENFEVAEKFTTQLINTYPDNLLFRFHHFEALLYQNRVHEAESYMQIIRNYADSNPTLTKKQSDYILALIEKTLQEYKQENNVETISKR